MSNKMDRQGARTPADVERRYNFGKSFAEVNEIATGARETAEKALEYTELSQEDIFRILTNNGQAQGIFERDGQIYINAEYVAFDELNGKDILMSGTFTNTTEAYLEPGMEEVYTIRQHILGNVTIPDELLPFYDIDGDGELTPIDMLWFRKAYLGDVSIQDLPFAKKSKVALTIDLSDPNKAIRFTGKNMWGRDVDAYVGVNYTSVTNPATEKQIDALSVEYIVEQKTELVESDEFTVTWKWEKWNSGKARMTGRFTTMVDITQAYGSIYRSDGIYVSLPSLGLTSVDTVITGCHGSGDPVWTGQAAATSDIAVELTVFSALQNTARVTVNLEVTGTWK